MRPIVEVARELGLPCDALIPYGRYMGKVPLDAFPPGPARGRLVVVTAMSPTPAGEGKTTTAIGLVDALSRLGKRAVLTLRQPSLGPVFGLKGGGTGGGEARVVPEEDINLHFTGDAHAVAAAHNLLAALADNAVHHQLIPGLSASGLEWHRVTNIEDRALRRVVTGLGGRGNGPLRETGFDLDAASEIMAILALAKGYEDLRKKLGRIVVGYDQDRRPVAASALNAVGSMMALLKDSLMPNLVQTLEGQPALVHTGPFGNIAHGASSILADRLALGCGDTVVTEAGFGADLGLEKFVHIKVRSGGPAPAAAVVVVTVRALKWHGGAPLRELESPNLKALQNGLANMEHALGIAGMFGLPAVVAINRFPADRAEEVKAIKCAALSAGAVAVSESFAFSRGGAGAVELAEAVVEACKRGPCQVNYLYPLEASLEKKVETVARQVYGAGEVQWDANALRQARTYTELGWGSLPICMAKTHLSLSADPRMVVCPQGYTFPIGGIRIAAGAGFVYPMAGEIQTMPALPRNPKAFQIDVDDHGNLVGLAKDVTMVPAHA
ncbi:MAG: formate--tetrahydrofolate ligase [Chloroflexi bacterium]|nr:formate--tetrahydrofolate ligase [Chloroflexota bacterium]